MNILVIWALKVLPHYIFKRNFVFIHMNLGRFILLAILFASVVFGVYVFYLGGFDDIRFSESLDGEFFYVWGNYSGKYMHDEGVFRLGERVDEFGVEGVEYVFYDNETGIVLDRVSIGRLSGFLVKNFSSEGCIVGEFDYRDYNSFIIGDLIDSSSIRKYSELNSIDFEKKVVVFDSINNKIKYFHC